MRRHGDCTTRFLDGVLFGAAYCIEKGMTAKIHAKRAQELEERIKKEGLECDERGVPYKVQHAKHISYKDCP